MSSLPAGGSRAGRRWEGGLVAALLGLAAVAWYATAQLGSPEMRFGLLTRGTGMSSMHPTMAEPMARDLLSLVPMALLFLLTWVVMMVAMMFPAVVPVVLTFDRWVGRTGRSRWTTALFICGYLLVWSAAGLGVFAAIVYIQPLIPLGEASVRLGAVVLMGAGAYQLSPLKAKCLKHCRSPLAFVAEHATELRAGGLGPAKVGSVHGLFCLGCCWALMVVLVLLGMMSLVWMAAIAGVIFLEKVVPKSAWVPRAVAGVLIGAGAILLAFPTALTAVG